MTWRSPSSAHVAHGAQRTTDEALDLLRAPRRLAACHLAPDPLGRQPGSIEYSAVTQPLPLPFIQRGTSSSTDAVHSTRVRPKATSTEPSADSVKSRSKVMGRSSSVGAAVVAGHQTSILRLGVGELGPRHRRRRPPRSDAPPDRRREQVGDDEVAAHRRPAPARRTGWCVRCRGHAVLVVEQRRLDSATSTSPRRLSSQPGPVSAEYARLRPPASMRIAIVSTGWSVTSQVKRTPSRSKLEPVAIVVHGERRVDRACSSLPRACRACRACVKSGTPLRLRK